MNIKPICIWFDKVLHLCNLIMNIISKIPIVSSIHLTIETLFTFVKSVKNKALVERLCSQTPNRAFLCLTLLIC